MVVVSREKKKINNVHKHKVIFAYSYLRKCFLKFRSSWEYKFFLISLFGVAQTSNTLLHLA